MIVKINLMDSPFGGTAIKDVSMDAFTLLPHEASRLMTGTTGESNVGIFTEHETRIYFELNGKKKFFVWHDIDFESDTTDYIVSEITTRILQVRDWVESFKKRRIISFEIPEIKKEN